METVEQVPIALSEDCLVEDCGAVDADLAVETGEVWTWYRQCLWCLPSSTAALCAGSCWHALYMLLNHCLCCCVANWF